MNLERTQNALLAACAATCLLTIFAAQALLGLALAVFVARCFLRRTRLARSALDAPILAFIVWTLLSASFSADPAESFRTGGKKLVLFVLLYVCIDSLSDPALRQRIMGAALLGGLALSLRVVTQYHWFAYDTLARRPTGFLGHWMTASGLIMGALLIASARLAFSRPLPLRLAPADALRIGSVLAGLAVLVALGKLGFFAVEGERLFLAAIALLAATMVTGHGQWPGPATVSTLAAMVVPVAAWALLVSGTRSAWLGAVAGLAAVAILFAPRTLGLLGLAIAVLLLLRPAPLINRLTLTDASSLDRYYMWQAGLEMIRDQPIFGQGPGMVPVAYARYRWPQAPSLNISHLHNNVLQIAAERGLPCLAFWLWWVAATLADSLREFRRADAGSRWGPVATFGLLTAVLIAGMFEYNFGDSEVLYLILIISAIPYALRRQRELALTP